MSCMETGAPFEEVVRFLVVAFFLVSACFCFFCYYSNVAGPMGNQIMYERLHQRMFEKATDVELVCSETPDTVCIHRLSDVSGIGAENNNLWQFYGFV